MPSATSVRSRNVKDMVRNAGAFACAPPIKAPPTRVGSDTCCIVNFTAGPPTWPGVKVVRNPVAGSSDCMPYPMFPANCKWLLPNKDVASANVVPRSDWFEEENGLPSPDDTFTTPRVSEKIEADEEGEEETVFGSNIRSTGRVAIELRSTHFQSSLIKAPEFGDEYTSSTELKTEARLIARTLVEPAWIAILRFNAGMKLVSVTRIE